MKQKKYKDIFKEALLKSGYKKKWVQEQMNMNKITFYRAIHNDTLSAVQKENINNLLSK